MVEYNWIEFEIWMHNQSIQGYMAEEEADDEDPLCWYDEYGLECSSLGNTYKGEPTDTWYKMYDWICTHDLIQYLIDFKDEETHLMFKVEDDFGRIDVLDLYINTTKKDVEGE